MKTDAVTEQQSHGDSWETFENTFSCITLDHQIDYDSVKAQSVGGGAGVVPRVLCFD